MTVQYVMYFRFADNVMFSHNGANGSESKTTYQRRRYVSLSSPGGSTVGQRLMSTVVFVTIINCALEKNPVHSCSVAAIVHDSS